MFKTNEEIIIIQAKATTPIPTGVVFWSHDKGTAKMLFQLQKDYVNQTLSEGTIVPICLDFVGGRHIYHAVIEDAINGIVSIVLEDNILGYVGRVTGSIYIELPDSRSLDTAGRFTFDIKRSPIDLNTPELEDYYWQGFNEIIDEYHQTINTIKSEAKALIDSLTADVTTAQSKITQLEQSITTANTNLNARIDEINKKIDDNDVFTKAESSANVIDNIAGTEKAILKNGLLIDGISGTGARDDNGTLIPFVQDDYYKLASTDTYVRNETLVSGRGAEIQFDFNVIETLESRYPAIFESSTTIAEKISKYKTIIKNVNANIIIRGRGIHSSTNVATNFSRLFLSWGTNYSNNTSLGIASSSDFSKINSNLSVLGINSISNKGYYTLFAVTRRTGASDNGAVSDGVTPAWVEVKDISLTVELEVNGRTIIESMIAANHVENLATQEEAETGEDNKKIMTPLRVMQSIKKFVENKFVSIAGNETIGGLKNFRDGLMVNGNNVLTHKGVVTIKYSNADFPTEIASGYITFVRYSDVIQAVFNFKTRIGNDFAKDQSIIWGIAADFQADTSEPQYIGITSTGGTTSIVKFTAGGSTLTAHSILLKDTWYAGTVTYLAKNKL